MELVAAMMLEEAGTFEERVEAVETCMDWGVPLIEIEEKLDILDSRTQQLQNCS